MNLIKYAHNRCNMSLVYGCKEYTRDGDCWHVLGKLGWQEVSRHEYYEGEGSLQDVESLCGEYYCFRSVELMSVSKINCQSCKDNITKLLNE